MSAATLFRRAYRIAILFVMLAGHASAALAQATLDQVQKALVSPWFATIDGEPRPYLLRILGVGQKGDGGFLLDATYGWIDAEQLPVRAELTQSGSARSLRFTMQGDRTVEASQSADGVFTGTVRPKTGAPKTIRLERISEADVQMKVMAAMASTISLTYANEDKDWGIEPTSTPRRTEYHAPTPRSHPRAKTIKTMELKSLVDANKSVVVIDVLGGVKDRTTIPGAHWMPGAGQGAFYAAEQRKLAAALDKLTGGDRKRPIVFLCLSAECWLSYNAALHAAEAGYTNLMWYRGGTDAWSAAGFARKGVQAIAW